MPRLRRSQLDGPSITRRRIGKGFSYHWSSGGTVDDPDVLARIRALAIPPAWTDVWICPWPNGHIQAVGTDAAGRRQYRYHDEWRRRRDAEKFTRMLEFATALPALRAAVTSDLALEGLPRERVLALAVRLLDVGMFRVGGEEYAEEHQTYGLATLEKRHARITKGTVVFDYEAKGGKERLLTITDPPVVALIGRLKRRRGGGEALLAWKEGDRWIDVRSDDVNTYLKERSGGPFSAKDFRTWGASLLAAVLCAKVAASGSSSGRNRQVSAMVRQVSELLGNTPAVCRKSYIDPRVIDRFEHGETISALLDELPEQLNFAEGDTLCRIEQAVVALLADEIGASAERAA
ncbi:MAG: topoisomerase [Acidimicrobiaceae bacterium]|nr:topoisomerase [Acidimicrobiaceae bacterium]